MTAVPDFVDISAGHSVPHDIEQHALIGLRETLGAVYADSDFSAQFSEARRRNPDIVTLGYPFLTGPKRGATVSQQITYWKAHHRCDLGALDWERDKYKTPDGDWHDMGIQSFAAVLDGLDMARHQSIDAGLYASLYLFTRDVVEALIARKTPLLWIAAYGLAIPAWIVTACEKAGVFLIQQYAGDTLDRDRVLVGTLEQLHALAGRALNPAPGDAPSSGDPMTNLFPVTAHRVVDLPAGTVLEETPGGPKHTTLGKATTFGLLGATGTHFQIADGDAGVYVKRAGLTPRTADKNVGA